MLKSLSARLVFFGLFVLAAVAMIFARFFLQAYMELNPCPLCMSQRVFVVLWGLIALIATIHNPHHWGRRVYSALITLSALLGGAIAARHVWLQHLPPEQVPACGPSLEYMLETLPFSDTLSIVLKGDGNCAETVWTFMGLSIPEQTLGLFALVVIVGVWQMLRTYPEQK